MNKLDKLKREITQLQKQLADQRQQKFFFGMDDLHRLRVRDMERRIRSKQAVLYRMEESCK